MYSEKPKLHEKQRAHVSGSLRTVTIGVTSECNMACHHCYAEAFAGKEAVPLDILSNAFDELHDIGVFHFILQGGEPLVDMDRLSAIIGFCRPEESYITVVSNGWLMTSQIANELLDLGVDKVAFSLDSGFAHEHDAMRRIGSFGRVLFALRSVLETGMDTSISTVVTHGNVMSRGFDELLHLASGLKIRLDVQIAEPVGKWDGDTSNLITPEDAMFLKWLQRHLTPLPNGKAAIHRDIYSGEFDHCPAVTEFMDITVDGNVLPCNFLHFTMGNIRNESIRDMRNKLLGTRWFDGKQRVCLCGEDKQFINQIIIPNAGKKKPLCAVETFLKER